jgi:hypothetical protein
LRTFLALHDFELYSIALGQRFETVSLDGAKVDEDIGSAFMGNEAVTLRVVEPLHGAGYASH